MKKLVIGEDRVREVRTTEASSNFYGEADAMMRPPNRGAFYTEADAMMRPPNRGAFYAQADAMMRPPNRGAF